eukprot:TRINITY_DN17672_c0_g1_i2.p1 TRINITY_DN17672_c0_g1~~TRINITY_DN17672_c0_g1_i2.p1  ORF type:complete len:134 (+),score=9.00 TRINITY_DN17672_c0_g1_i2:30-431(+)
MRQPLSLIMFCWMAYARKGCLELCSGFFQETKNIAALPDTTTYNILIHAYVKESNYMLVKQLLLDMSSQNLVADTVTYASLSYGLCNEGKISAALHLRNRMVENGITPSINIYNTMLDAMFRRGKLWNWLIWQ